MEKPFTYVAFGDSHTFGSRCDGWVERNGSTWDGLPPDENWNSFVNLLYRDIQRQHPNAKLVNAGIPGDHVKSALQRMERDVIAHNPDLITVQFGINDCWTRFSSLRLSVFKRGLKQILETCKGTGAKVVAFTSAPVAMIGKNYGYVGELRTKKPYEVYMDIFKDVALNSGVKFVDIYREIEVKLLLQPLLGAEIFNEAAHLNEKGHRIYYECLSQEIAK